MNKIEIYSAGCSLCIETINRIKSENCDSCKLIIHDLHDPEEINRARKYGITRVPSVIVNGALSPCCKCSDAKVEI